MATRQGREVSALSKLLNERPRRSKDRKSRKDPSGLEFREAATRWLDESFGYIEKLSGRTRYRTPFKVLGVRPVNAEALFPNPERNSKSEVTQLVLRSSDLLIELGLSELQAGRTQAAEAASKLSIDLVERSGRDLELRLTPSSRAYSLLAEISLLTDQDQTLYVQYLKGAIELQPESTWARQKLVAYHVGHHDYETAIAYLKPVLDEGSADVRALANILSADSRPSYERHPSNSYSYRYALVSSEQLLKLREGIAGISSNSLTTMLSTVVDGDGNSVNEDIRDWLLELVPAPPLGIEDIQGNPNWTDVDWVFDTNQPGEVALSRTDWPRIKTMAVEVLRCHQRWNAANEAFNHGKFLLAVRLYGQTIDLIESWFERYRGTSDPEKLLVPGSSWTIDIPDSITGQRWRVVQTSLPLVAAIRNRWSAVAVEELHQMDWKEPLVAPDGYHVYANAEDMLRAFGRWPNKANEKIDAPLAKMLFLFCPWAIAEATKARGRYHEGDGPTALGRRLSPLQLMYSQCQWDNTHGLMNWTIEGPFSTLLFARLRLMEADAQYRRDEIDSNPEIGSDGNVLYRGLLAHRSYVGVKSLFRSRRMGGYVDRIERSGVDFNRILEGFRSLSVGKKASQIRTRLLQIDPASQFQFSEADSAAWAVFEAMGIEPLVDGVTLAETEIGSRRSTAPERRALRFTGDGAAQPYSNPLIYALLAEVQGRIEQIEAGFNYLGYPDNYLSPWRFSFLLERSRYLAEQAKRLQASYLRFLESAENEEYRERSAANNAAQEEANVAVEIARLNEARAALAASKAASDAAELEAANSQIQAAMFVGLDAQLDDLQRRYNEASAWATAGTIISAGESSAFGAALKGAGVGEVLGQFALGAALSSVSAIPQYIIGEIQQDMQNVHREYEKEMLRLGADQAAAVASAAELKVAVAEHGMMAARLQVLAARMRQDYALDVLEFLRNRSANAELWYRLTHQVKEIARSYLQSAVEVAFLAEQSLEFELGERLDLIRFDYEQSELGDYLAGEFLLKDLSSLEHRLITGTRQKRQHFRMTLSLARQFPTALLRLREHGSTMLDVPLTLIEHRFPGMCNVRLLSATTTLAAHMDPTRFSMELTHLGRSIVRVQRPAAADGVRDDPFFGSDLTSWCPEADKDWPAKLRVSHPDTKVLTGISHTDERVIDIEYEPKQRAAFEGLGAASMWYIDLSVQENRIETSSIADLLISFELSALYDGSLDQTISAHLPTTEILSLPIFARSNLPDEFHRFIRTGRMRWPIGENWVPPGLKAGSLLGMGLVLHLDSNAPDYGPVGARHSVDLLIRSVDGKVEYRSPSPEFNIATHGLQVQVTLDGVHGGYDHALWSFDGGASWQDANTGTVTHDFAEPGQATIMLRIFSGGRAFDRSVFVSLSPSQKVYRPCLAHPVLSTRNHTATDAELVIELGGIVADDKVHLMYRIGDTTGTGKAEALQRLTYDQVHRLELIVSRDITATLTSSSLPLAGLPISIVNLRVSGKYDDAGTADASTLTQGLFASGHLPSVLDEWELVLSVDDNPFIAGVSPWDAPSLDLGEIADLTLLVDYEAERLQ